MLTKMLAYLYPGEHKYISQIQNYLISMNEAKVFVHVSSTSTRKNKCKFKYLLSTINTKSFESLQDLKW